MNFFILFATSADSFILVIGRRFAVKSAVGIYGEGEIDTSQTGFVGSTFDCQGEQPTN